MRARALQQLWLFEPARRFAAPLPDAHTRDVVDVVVMTVASHYGASIDAVRSTTRRQPTAQIRMIAMFVARTAAKLGPVAIGGVLKRDPSTITHGVQQIEKALQFDPFLRANVAAVTEKIRAAIAQLAA